MKNPEHQDYEKLIIKKARAFNLSTGVPLDELLGQGNLTFVESLQTYESSKTSFSTWLSIRLQQDFIKLCRRWMKNSSASDEQVVDTGKGMFCCHFQSPEKIFFFKEALNNMGELSKSIVHSLLDNPGAIFGDLDNCSIGAAREKIRKHFRDNGCTIKELQLAFQEIKAVL